MPLIAWHDKFETGDPGVDEEHREIIDLINQLHERLQKTDQNREQASLPVIALNQSNTKQLELNRRTIALIALACRASAY